ncbi:MAG: DNA repair protein RadC [Paludibacteraceae bacterium]|nr:DNA repair protein RadC [Paludibacteraceae bacterium]
MENESSTQKGNPPSKEGDPNHKPITSFSDEDKPREKMMANGARSLTNSELLAILIATGTPKKTAIEVCQALLEKTGNSLRKLYDMDWRAMTEIEGIGPAKAITIKAALEIGHRVPSEQKEAKVKCTSSEQIFKFIKPTLEYLPHEEMWIIYVKQDLTIIDKEKVSEGSSIATSFDIRKIVRNILDRKTCCAVVLVHNHPSGNLTPSQQDKNITRQLRDACKLFDVRLLDHIIVGEEEYYSFLDSNLINEL